jgi:hypothetical protein
MFSVNSYDSDGDLFEVGVYLHFGDTRVRVADTIEDFLDETNGIKRKIDNMVNEITENYGDYSKKARGTK